MDQNSSRVFSAVLNRSNRYGRYGAITPAMWSLQSVTGPLQSEIDCRFLKSFKMHSKAYFSSSSL